MNQNEQHASATLITKGRVSRAQLAGIPTPPATATWKPVPHAELIDRLEDELGRRQIRVVSQDYGIQRGGRQLFGIMVLGFGETGDRQAALGIRAANDKTMAIQLCVGTQVLVCENMAFSGDALALNKRHTSLLDLPKAIEGAVGAFEDRYAVMAREFESLKSVALSDDAAKVILYDAVIGQKLVPVTYLPAIHQEYFTPTFSVHQPGSLYSLNQAFTYAIREMSPAGRIATNMRIGKYFGLHGRAGSAERLAIEAAN